MGLAFTSAWYSARAHAVPSAHSHLASIIFRCETLHALSVRGLMRNTGRPTPGSRQGRGQSRNTIRPRGWCALSDVRPARRPGVHRSSSLEPVAHGEISDMGRHNAQRPQRPSREGSLEPQSGNGSNRHAHKVSRPGSLEPLGNGEYGDKSYHQARRASREGSLEPQSGDRSTYGHGGSRPSSLEPLGSGEHINRSYRQTWRLSSEGSLEPQSGDRSNRHGYGGSRPSSLVPPGGGEESADRVHRPAQGTSREGSLEPLVRNLRMHRPMVDR